MRKTGWIALALAVAAGVDAAEADRPPAWTQQSGAGTTLLRGVATIDADTAVAVGNGGRIYRKTASAAAWAAVTSPTSSTLYAVDFVDDKHGWAVGDSGRILFSKDGGQSWTDGQPPGTEGLRAVSMVRTSKGVRGVAVGRMGALRVYEQDAWSSFYLASSDDLKGAAAVGSSLDWKAWAVGSWGGDSTRGVILKYVPKSWTVAWIGNPKLTGVCFLDENTGWAAGEQGKVLKTVNGGDNWTSYSMPNGFTGTLYAICAPDAQTVCAVGQGGKIFYCSDGATWKEHANPLTSPVNLNGVALPVSAKGWAVGNTGCLLRYE